MGAIQFVHGVAIIDPHGDLIGALLPHVPKERLNDVILFDPSDEEYAIAFNLLGASSSQEKEYLAGDFIAVMRQHTSSWGHQMFHTHAVEPPPPATWPCSSNPPILIYLQIK